MWCFPTAACATPICCASSTRRRSARKFAISVDLPGAALDIVGADTIDGSQVAEVGPDQTRELRAIVSLDRSAANTQPIRFTITDRADGKTASAIDNFRGPGETK